MLNIIAIIIIAMLLKINLNNGKAKAEEVTGENVGTEQSFDLLVSPEETRVKAGETVEISLDLSKINVGETGLNSIVRLFRL